MLHTLGLYHWHDTAFTLRIVKCAAQGDFLSPLVELHRLAEVFVIGKPLLQDLTGANATKVAQWPVANEGRYAFADVGALAALLIGKPAPLFC